VRVGVRVSLRHLDQPQGVCRSEAELPHDIGDGDLVGLGLGMGC
jgi:hypothetical protein